MSLAEMRLEDGSEGRLPPRQRDLTPVARALKALGSARFAGVWVLGALLVLFGALRPETFLTMVTLRTTLADQAIVGLMALAVLLPLVAGLFDLSTANVAGWALVLSATLSADTGLPTPVILLITLATSAAFGALSGVFVTRLQVNSLVATLGVGTVALGLTMLVADSKNIVVDFGHVYSDLGQGYLGFMPWAFLFLLVVAALMYVVLEHTPLGRRMQACGGNPTAARLAGIRVGRLQFAVLVAAALFGGLAGFLLAARVGVATDITAPGYLLPAAAALFLGTTQFKDRPNVAGTILAILILGAGIKGLQLLGASAWVNSFFAGSVLLLSVGIASTGRGGLNRIH